MQNNQEYKKIAQAFSQAAYRYDELSQVQLAVGEYLLTELGCRHRSATRVLDAGCGTGRLTEALTLCFPRAELVAVDIATGMIERAKQRMNGYAQAQVQLADLMKPITHLGQFDLIFSSFTLHWCGSPELWLAHLLQVLAPGGVLILSLPVEGSLSLLQQAWSRVDSARHINTFPKEVELQAVLARHRVSIEWQQTRVWYQYFDKLGTLLHSIKDVGAHQVVKRTSKTGLMGRKAFLQIEHDYRDLSDDPQLRLACDYRVWSGVVSQ